jgi:hypothetical protein
MILIKPQATLTTQRMMFVSRALSLLSRTGAWQIAAVAFFVAVQISVEILIALP